MIAGMDVAESDRLMKGISPLGYRYLFDTAWGRFRGIGAGLPMDMSTDSNVDTPTLREPWIKQLRRLGIDNMRAPWTTHPKHLHGQSDIVAQPLPRPATVPPPMPEYTGHESTADFQAWIPNPNPNPNPIPNSNPNLNWTFRPGSEVRKT